MKNGQKRKMEQLIKLINEASDAYYNSGEEIMSNFEYDKLYDEFESLEDNTGVVLPNSPTLRAGTDADSGIAKITHEYQAFSPGMCIILRIEMS